MKLPIVIGPIEPNGNTLEGIFNEIKTKYSISNPIKSRIVVPSASSNCYNSDPNTLVLWNYQYWLSNISDEIPYAQLHFPGRKLQITSYSLRGVTGTENGYYYQKKWKVEGFNEGEEEDKNKWDILAENTSSEGDFCGTGYSCKSQSIATFSTKKTRKAYSYFRWTALEPSHSNYLRFATSAIEVYGTLFLSKLTCTHNRCIYGQSTRFVYLYVLIIS